MRWVGLTHLFVLAITPALTAGCCQETRRWRNPDLSNSYPLRHHYRVVLGEPFQMKCVGKSSLVKWYRSMAGGGVEEPVTVSTENLLKIAALTADHSGNYSCRTDSGEGLDLQLQVLEGTRLGCSEPEPKQVTLTLDGGSGIYCPSSSCEDPDLSDSQVTWYKNGFTIPELQLRGRNVCNEGPRLVVCTVSEQDSAVFSCDRHTKGPGPLRITRRSFNVKVIPPDTGTPPMIMDPNSNKTEEVVIGEPHTLWCNVTFGFERNFTSTVQWYTSTAADQALKVLIGQKEHTRRKTLWSFETVVTQMAVLQKVTELDLRHVFTCLATNAVGTTNRTTRLRRREAAGHWLAGAVGPVVCVALLAGLGVALHLINLELTLIYRSYWQSSNHAGDRKDIDVFLSHSWSHASEDGSGTHTALLPSPWEPGSPLSREPLAYTPLEGLLRLALEGSGYRLFLMERDLLPGGAYTEDVVRIIQRSRCLVCLLSGDFLSNSSAVFVLEAGVQALLRDPELKVMVIWTEPRPASMGQLDPPLPRLVHRALRVLPRLDWLPGLSPDSSRMFWKSFWKAMPKLN